MNIEKYFHKLFGSRAPKIDEDIEEMWGALQKIRRETENLDDVEWVKLSSWTSTEGDIGGVMIGDEENNIQLFISNDRGLDAQGKLTGYSISVFRTGSDIDEHWDTGSSTNRDSNIRDTVEKFEAYLRGLLAARL